MKPIFVLVFFLNVISFASQSVAVGSRVCVVNADPSRNTTLSEQEYADRCKLEIYMPSYFHYNWIGGPWIEDDFINAANRAMILLKDINNATIEGDPRGEDSIELEQIRATSDDYVAMGANTVLFGNQVQHDQNGGEATGYNDLRHGRRGLSIGNKLNNYRRRPVVLRMDNVSATVKRFTSSFDTIPVDLSSGERYSKLKEGVAVEKEIAFNEHKSVLVESKVLPDSVEIGLDSVELLVKNDTVRINGVFQDSYGDIHQEGEVLTGRNGRLKWQPALLPSLLVSNYDDLRSLVPSSTDSVAIVADFTYIFETVAHTTVGGLFYYSGCTENGGTCIGGWSRVFDGITYIPEWWEVGGYGIVGTDSLILNSGDQVRACTNILGKSSKEVKCLSGKTYEFDHYMDIGRNTTIDLNGATFMKKDQISSTVVSTTSNTIILDDVSNFRIGHLIFHIDVSHSDPQSDSAIRNLGSITDISNNTLTFSGNTTGINPADIIVVSGLMWRVNYPTNDITNITIKNGTFDGNKSSHTLNYSWLFNNIGGFPSTIGNRIENCHFQNVSNENVFIAGGSVNNCSYEELNGSFLHISKAVVVNYYEPLLVTSCHGVNSGLAPFAQSNHNEGVITYSSNSDDVFISSCIFKNDSQNLDQAVFGTVGSEDSNVHIDNCEFENFNEAFRINPSGGGLENKRYFINNTKFINCKEVSIKGGAASRGQSVTGIFFNNNEFTNTRCFFQNITEGIIDNNQFKIDTSYTMSSNFDGNPPDYNQPLFIAFINSERIRFTNNLVRGPLTYNSNLQYGLGFAGQGVRKLSNGTNTIFRYCQDIIISGNTIENFKYGITYQAHIFNGGLTSAQLQQGQGEHVGIKIYNNTIFCTRDINSGTESWGILAGSGVIIDNNVVYGSLPVTYGLWVMGADDTNNEQTQIIGAIATNNTVYTDRIFIGGINGSNCHNIRFTDNKYTSQLFYGNQSEVQANWIEARNQVIDNTSFPALTNRPEIIYRSWKEDKGVY